MHTSTLHTFRPAKGKEGYLLLYVMGTFALLSLFGLIAAGSAMTEARSARNRMWEAQAHSHAEAGGKMVKREVETRLLSGQTLAQALSNLKVTAPSGVEFDDIDTFKTTVPERMFTFEVTGRSGEAEVTLAVQFRRKEMLEAGVFGISLVNLQNNLSVYGYDSRDTPNPAPGDSNGAATIGGNVDMDFKNNLTLDGFLVLGADESGNPATVSGLYGVETIEVGHINEDPLGAYNGGYLSQLADQVRLSNDNHTNAAIVNDRLDTNPGDEVTFEAGDYYLTEIDTAPNTEITIDNSSGPVRFFVDGEIYFAPNNGLALNDPFGLQIYAMSSDDIVIQPNGDLSAMIYAPESFIEIKPNGRMMGAFWGNEIVFKPNGVYYIDTSLQDRWLSNELVSMAQYAVRRR